MPNVTAVIGTKTFKLDIAESDGSDSNETDNSEGPLTTFAQLKAAIAEQGNLDQSCMKIIHRGRTLTGADDYELTNFKFKEGDKMLVMGKTKVSLKDDPGYSMLVQYEKDHLVTLQKQLEEILKDLTEIEKNFLDEAKSRDMAKRMDKRIKLYTEVSLRHLESIDALQINTEKTTEQQATRNREKRKLLVNGIQKLLNENDTYLRRLEEYVKKLDGEIVE